MPEVILLKDVENVGERGAVVDVSKGYMRNYLAPRRLAQPATKGALEAVRRSQEAADRAQEQTAADARASAEQLDRTVLTIEQQAGDDGRLFGSVTTFDIVEALKGQGFEVERSMIRLPQGPLKTVGDHAIAIALHTDVLVHVKISVLGETPQQ